MRFDKFIEIILDNEGGYVNDPHDWGGETKYGIAKRYFPDEDIKNLTLDRAKELYKQHYYKPLNLHFIRDDELALHIFDMAVNAGRIRAVRLLQQLLYIDDDGVIGPVTGGAVASAQDYVNLTSAYKAKRVEYYYRIAQYRSNMKFLKGWVNRVYKTNLRG
jgi:lysozyme family protein